MFSTTIERDKNVFHILPNKHFRLVFGVYIICQDVVGNDFAQTYKVELNYFNNHTTLL